MDILIDASRNRSGGAISHILGILNDGINPNIYGINKVYICSYSKLLNLINDKPWLNKVNHSFLEKSIFHQLLWQIFILPRFFKKKKVDILPKRFKEFKNLLNGNMSRINCVILPIEGLIKAFNMNK